VTHWLIKWKRDNKIAEIFETESKDRAKTPGPDFSGALGRNDNSGILGSVGEAHKNSRFNAKWGILRHSVLLF
jgi:hypothetical protein